MEEFGLARFEGIHSAVRKKRSQTSRRPKPDAQPVIDIGDHSPRSTTPPSDDMSKGSSDENVGTNSRRKEFNLNQCMSKGSPATEVESEKYYIRNKDSGGVNAFYCNDIGRSALNNVKRSSEGVLSPANWKNTAKVKESFDSESKVANIYSGRNGEIQSSEQPDVILDASVNDNKVKKVKLKVCGVTRTIHANSTTDDASSIKNSRYSEASRSQQKQNVQGDLAEDHSISDKRTGLQGVPWKGFSAGGFSLCKDNNFMGKVKNTSGKQGEKSEPVRKSKRVPKRRVLDGENGEDSDDEIRYLEKLKAPKIAGGYNDDEELSKKQRKLSSMDKNGASKLVKDGKKKSILDKASEDTDYEEEEDMASEGELEGNAKKKQKKESVDTLMDGKREMTLTTRQRALQSSKDGSTPGANLIEFPNGLPPAPSRKQKEKLSEVEQQLKKAEAAQRRRMQVEKAARESEAEAIRKILGQDSSRKKREDKIKKRQEELAQEKAANALTLASNTIRWVMGPSGTTVTFPKEMGFPSVIDSKPCSYPPPREKCAGPSCTNPYKYRDSKSKLPLCSLKCYKAVQGQMETEASSS